MFRSGVSFRVLSRSNPPRNAATNSFRFRSYEKGRILHYFGANKSLRIGSYRHPSSTPFRLRSYKNTGGGGYPNTFASPASSLPYPASRTICTRLYPLWPHSIAHTSRHHGGVPSPAQNPLCALRASVANPLLSYSCPLFCLSEKVNSFPIKQIHPLSSPEPGLRRVQKDPGGVCATVPSLKPSDPQHRRTLTHQS